MDTNVYKMNFTTGKVEALEIAPKLERGHLIYAYGYACNLQMFAVTNPDTRECVEIDRLPVNSVDELPDSYFSPISSYDERIEPHAKRYGIGFYYADEGEPLATDDQIASGLERAERIKHFTEVREELRTNAMNEAQAAARKEYGKILAEASGLNYHEFHKTAADNLRKLLRHTFPGFKFSLRKSSGNYYYLDWTDGPTREQVAKITDLFDDKVRDKYNDDLWDNAPTGFTSVFGSLDCWPQREISKERRAEILAKLNEYAPGMDECKQLDKCDILNAAKGMPEEWQDIVRECYRTRENLSEWAYTIAHGLDFLPKTEPKAEPKPEPISADGLQIVDYSDKAIAVIGNTKPIADTLKANGGRFNPRLTCGAGWIFSKRNEAKLRAALAI